jgi:hypothetical protein
VMINPRDLRAWRILHDDISPKFAQDPRVAGMSAVTWP